MIKSGLVNFFLFAILSLYYLQVTHYFHTTVVTLQSLTFTANVCCSIINMLGCFFSVLVAWIQV